jgi:hypothetical protein
MVGYASKLQSNCFLEALLAWMDWMDEGDYDSLFVTATADSSDPGYTGNHKSIWMGGNDDNW